MSEILKAEIDINSMIYRNGDFAIVSANVHRLKEGSAEPHYSKLDEIILKGPMPTLQTDGSLYNVTAEYVKDQKYGDQYNVINIFTAIEFGENDEVGQKKFLLSIFTPLQVNSMYEAIENPFEALKKGDTEALVQIKHCGMRNAAKWINRFKDNYDKAKVFVELEDYGLSNTMVEKLINRYKSPDMVIEKVKTNPYILATEVRGIGFKKADQIALEGGMKEDCPERIGAFMLYYLEDCAENGLSWITPDMLLGAILETLGDDISDEAITNAIHHYEDHLWFSEDRARIGLKRYYNLEHRVAEELIRLRDAESNITYDNWEDKIKVLERRQGWEFTEEQINGVKAGLENNVTIITGLSGVGKTSVVKGILAVLNNYSFAQIALSGRAASRLMEVTGKQGSTIHRALGYPKGDKQKFVYHDDNPLEQDIYILDEISMVSSEIFYYLLRAIPSGAKVYLLGDIGQLESIGAGNVAHDMINSGEIATVQLTKIHRQAAKSAIVTESIKVRNGEQLVPKDWVGIETRGELQDLTLECFSDSSNTYHRIIKTFKNYYKQPDFDVMETQIIVPVKNRGDACTSKLNIAIQDIVNPDPDNKKGHYRVLKDGQSYILREGDKVINRVNNYNTSPAIYNGNMGILESMYYDEEEDDQVMQINFKSIGRVLVPRKYWNNIDLAYAITVHSDQGSEHDNVIFGIDMASYALLTKELVYTGITRAKKKCELIAQTGALRYAVSHEGVTNKQTFLVECIQEIAHPKLVF